MNDIKGSYFFKAGDEINLEKYEFFKDRAKRYVAVRAVKDSMYCSWCDLYEWNCECNGICPVGLRCYDTIFREIKNTDNEKRKAI